MMNRIKYVIVIIGLAVSITACGSVSYPPNARSVVNAFLGELSEGDVEKALDYCDEEEDAYITLNSITKENAMHELAMDLAQDPKNQEKIENDKNIQRLLDSYYEYMFKNYQIVDYEDRKNDAVYTISISRLDRDESSIFGYVTDQSLFDDYFYDHQEELEKMYEEQGEEAVLMKYLEDIGKDMTDKYISELKNGARYSNQKYRITLKKEDSGWKILTMERW